MAFKKTRKLIILVVILFGILWLPYKVAVDYDNIDTSKGYIIDYYPVTGGVYRASKEMNPQLESDIYIWELSGNTPYECLNSWLEESWKNGEPPVNNKYYICGHFYELSVDGEVLNGFYVDSWDIVDHVNRDSLFLSVVLPYKHLTVWDVNWLNQQKK